MCLVKGFVDVVGVQLKLAGRGPCRGGLWALGGHGGEWEQFKRRRGGGGTLQRELEESDQAKFNPEVTIHETTVALPFSH